MKMKSKLCFLFKGLCWVSHCWYHPQSRAQPGEGLRGLKPPSLTKSKLRKNIRSFI